MIKTNAVRALDQQGIKYELRECDVDPHDLSAETVAAKIGLPPEQVFKTLAVQGDRNGTVPGCNFRITLAFRVQFLFLSHSVRVAI
jgi:prolyl-tRNA editing enzyme YbaK/EbsC (Cys-tRNA(Pro) deacylase)